MWVIPPEGSQNYRGGPEEKQLWFQTRLGRPEETGPDRAVTMTGLDLDTTGLNRIWNRHREEAYLHGRSLFSLFSVQVQDTR